MKLKKYLAIGACLCFASLSNIANSTPIDATGLDLTEVQSVFTTIGSSINANTDETGAEVFSFQSGSAEAFYIATVSATIDIEFGLYDVTDVSNNVTLFDTTSSNPGDSTTIGIQFNTATNTVVTYDDVFCAIAGTCTVFDSATFNSAKVGYYITTTYGTFYSQSDLNPMGTGPFAGENDHFLTYAAKGEAVDLDGVGGQPALPDDGHWYIAAEGTTLNGNADDFSDIMVQIESIVPVPAPATLALMGLGLLGLGLGRRRKV